MTAPTQDRDEPHLAPPAVPRPGPVAAAAARSPRIPRKHLIALVAIGVVGLLRGLFWVATTEVWSPIDEAHHYAFVASLATGHGIPTVGKDVVPVEVIEVEKASPTLPFRAMPHAPVLEDPYWVIEQSQYEAVQPPLYYALLVPAYWVSRPFGFLPSVYGLRIATLLIGLAAIPLTWMLAKDLFPRRPAIWLAAPAVLVAINGFNSNLAVVTNDSLVVPLAAVALLAATRFYRTPTLTWAAATGLALGAALLAKTSAIGLVGILALPYLLLLVTRRRPVVDVLKAGTVTGVCAGLVLLPWVLWNMATYGSPTAAAASNAITGQFMNQTGLNAQVIRDHLHLANANFWDSSLFQPDAAEPYQRVFVWAVVTAIVVGLAVSLARRDWRTLAGVAWTGAALPLAFLGMEAITFGVFHGVGQPQGRHLYIALVPVSVLIAAAAVVALGARWGVVAVAGVIALAFLAEQSEMRDYLSYTYTSGRIPPDLAPVVDQPLNEGFRLTTVFQAEAPCPVRAVALLVDGPPPPALTIGGTVTPLAGTLSQLTTRPRSADPDEKVYALAAPVTGSFEVEAAEPFLLGASDADTDPHLGFRHGPGDPVARLYCQVPDAERARFEQQFPPLHPSQLGWAGVQLWPRLWAGLGILGLLAAAGAARRPKRAAEEGADR